MLMISRHREAHFELCNFHRAVPVESSITGITHVCIHSMCCNENHYLEVSLCGLACNFSQKAIADSSQRTVNIQLRKSSIFSEDDDETHRE